MQNFLQETIPTPNRHFQHKNICNVKCLAHGISLLAHGKNNSSLQKMMNNQNNSVSLEIHMDLRITKKPEKASQLNPSMHLSLIRGDKRGSPSFNSHYFEGEGIFANRQTNLKHEILFKKKLFFAL